MTSEHRFIISIFASSIDLKNMYTKVEIIFIPLVALKSIFYLLNRLLYTFWWMFIE